MPLSERLQTCGAVFRLKRMSVGHCPVDGVLRFGEICERPTPQAPTIMLAVVKTTVFFGKSYNPPGFYQTGRVRSSGHEKFATPSKPEKRAAPHFRKIIFFQNLKRTAASGES
jgi:hypothetical protein